MIVNGELAQHQICADCIAGQMSVDAAESSNASIATATRVAIDDVNHVMARSIRKMPGIEAIVNEQAQTARNDLERIAKDGITRVVCGRDGPSRFGKCYAKQVLGNET